ncbi:hypothetical protein FBU30_005662 [Linnemannia zychae]|nr:hypothetical protein FBU30_005662 [Linnemannia zychae]
MSPAGRNRPFKGIHMPRNGYWDGPQLTIGKKTIPNGWSRNEGIFGAHAPPSKDGITYVYHRGPAGQTPFPTLVATPDYFLQHPTPSPSHSSIQSTSQTNVGPQPLLKQQQQQQQQQQKQQHPHISFPTSSS